MKTLKSISGLALITAMALGTAQAGNMTTNELFDYLQAGDHNSIESVETVELSKMEFSDVKGGPGYTAAVNVLDVINSD